MTVDIGDGRVDTIIVHEDDTCEDLAKEFQLKHNLIPEVIGPLTEHIRINLEDMHGSAEKKKLNRSNNTTTAPSHDRLFHRTLDTSYQDTAHSTTVSMRSMIILLSYFISMKKIIRSCMENRSKNLRRNWRSTVVI
jgi:hypothetical protein